MITTRWEQAHEQDQGWGQEQEAGARARVEEGDAAGKADREGASDMWMEQKIKDMHSTARMTVCLRRALRKSTS